MKETRVLYLSYLGLREPLVQTQVLPYLRQVIGERMNISLLTFEPEPKKNWTKREMLDAKDKLASEGIDWNYLTYHKSPSIPASFYDMAVGTIFVYRFIRNRKPHIIHGRADFPVLIPAMLARKFTRFKPKLLYDIRGFFPEEFTDSGRWKKDGWLYRLAKLLERWILKEADGFVVLTEKAREMLFPESKKTRRDSLGRPVEVIPCCVDFDRFGKIDNEFQEKFKKLNQLDGRFVVVYVGSFGGWYLTQEMVDFLAVAREENPSTFAMIITQGPQDEIAGLLRANGFDEKDYWIGKVAPERIPDYLGIADVGLSFIKPCYSKQSSSPTKNAEYLAAGLSIVANSGVGDTKYLTLEDGVGVIIDDFTRESYRAAFREVVELRRSNNVGEKSKESARNRFDLQAVGGYRYRRIYRKLLGMDPAGE